LASVIQIEQVIHVARLAQREQLMAVLLDEEFNQHPHLARVVAEVERIQEFAGVQHRRRLGAGSVAHQES
jgi:hypothetical protein